MNSRSTYNLNEVMSVSEAAKICGKNRASIVQVITKDNGRFKQNIDWRKSENIILVMADAMRRVYGDYRNPKELQSGVTTKDFEDSLGMTRVGLREIKLGDGFRSRKTFERVIYKHSSGYEVARIHDVWFILNENGVTSEYITHDKKLYEIGRPKGEDLEILDSRYQILY